MTVLVSFANFITIISIGIKFQSDWPTIFRLRRLEFYCSFMLWLLAYCFSNSSLLTVVECQKSLWRSSPLPPLINSLFPQAGVILGVKRASKCTCKPPLLCIHIVETRTNCSRKFLEMKSGSWQSWLGPSLGWQGWQVIICKRQVLLDDHLQKAATSRWSFANA